MAAGATGAAGKTGAAARIGESRLADRLAREIEGEVNFDAFSRGRYATDASIYQMEPIGVVVPRTEQDLRVAVQIAEEEGIPLLPRGGGTSQCGQTVNTALVLDCTKYLNAVTDYDPETHEVTVQPGLVLDHLNAWLKPKGRLFPVDVSTASRATLGGMTANNSCGGRSIHYGIMVDNVTAIDAILMDGTEARFDHVPGNLGDMHQNGRYRDLVQTVRSIAEREASEIEARIPKLMRRVGGYNLNTIDPTGARGGHNMASLLVGSEGTLALSRQIRLKTHAIPKHRVLGVCHFPGFRDAMANTKHLVTLKPYAVELIDRTMMDLAREIPMFRPIVEQFVRGEPDALLLVEFAGDSLEPLLQKLVDLETMMADLGFPDSVVRAEDAAFQARIAEVRKSGLNIMMSMKDSAKPVSFIEDCAVPLEDLADYTERLTEVFEKHGTHGTWYAHASVGCLHVRPVLNMKRGADVEKMRAIAEEAFAMVRAYKGSHSGEHGDGIVRSEFHRQMFGDRVVDAFAEIKGAFDPKGLMNPGRIVDPPKMDDRTLFRFKPDYAPVNPDTRFDWRDWGGLSGAVEMCNNNGACRKRDPGVMCPSFRVTGDEQHLVRGRANTLRLALSGQLGPDALTDPAMKETLDLCVGCKGCKRECPTGVDMAKMKTEVLGQYVARHGLSLKDKLVAHMPRYAEIAGRFHFLANLRDAVPGLPWLSEVLLGFARGRSLPKWSSEPFRASEVPEPRPDAVGEVVLFADTFNSFFEPDNLRAALRVLNAAGYGVHVLGPETNQGRHLCCGRTYLASGLIEEAKVEMRRVVEAVRPFAERGVPIVGLEPSCLFTLIDELPSLLREEAGAVPAQAMLFESFLAREAAAGRLDRLKLKPIATKALIHGHCHQKAFAKMGDVTTALELIPGLSVSVIESSCCGMAGAFGYEAEHHDVSMKMAELNLLPAVRAAEPDTLLVADGTSCRHQIHDGADRTADHVAVVLSRALAAQ
jgi:FAD/FMN-containing dehydrogenase/Fe-S oxidoreductase